MKLLLIPLRANNCKAERVAIEKFNTWWLLIRKIDTHIQYLIDDVLKPFITFCFLPIQVPAGGPKKDNNEIYLGHKFSEIIPYLLDSLLQIIGHKTENCQCISIIAERATVPLITNLFNPILITGVKEASILLLKAPDVLEYKNILSCLWCSLMRLLTGNEDIGIREGIAKAIVEVLNVYMEKKMMYLGNMMLGEIDFKKVFVEEKVKKIFVDGLKGKLKLICGLKKLDPVLNLICELEMVNELIFNVESLKTIDGQSLCKFWMDFGSFLYKNDPNSPYLTPYLKTPFELLKVQPDSKFLIWYEVYFNSFEDIKFPQEIFIDFCEFLAQIQSTSKELSTLVGYVLNSLISHLKIMSVPNTCMETILQILHNLLLESTKDNYFMVFSSINKLLKMFYINFVAITIILKSLPKFINNNTLVDKNHNDFIQMLTTIDEIVTQVNTDHFILTLILAAFKTYIKSEDKKINKLVFSLIKRCKLKLKISSPEQPKKLNRSAKILAMSSKTEDIKPNSEILGHDINTMTPVAKRTSFLNRITPMETATTPKPVPKNEDKEFVVINTEWKFDPRKITDKQKEKMKERGKDIPALYQDMSQSVSQDMFNIKNDKENVVKENSTAVLNFQHLIKDVSPINNVVEPIVLSRNTVEVNGKVGKRSVGWVKGRKRKPAPEFHVTGM